MEKKSYRMPYLMRRLRDRLSESTATASCAVTVAINKHTGNIEVIPAKTNRDIIVGSVMKDIITFCSYHGLSFLIHAFVDNEGISEPRVVIYDPQSFKTK